MPEGKVMSRLAEIIARTLRALSSAKASRGIRGCRFIRRVVDE